jgi:hypothetical protein
MEPEFHHHIKNTPETFSNPDPDRSSTCTPSRFLKSQFNIILKFY